MPVSIEYITLTDGAAMMPYDKPLLADADLEKSNLDYRVQDDTPDPLDKNTTRTISFTCGIGANRDLLTGWPLPAVGITEVLIHKWNGCSPEPSLTARLIGMSQALNRWPFHRFARVGRCRGVARTIGRSSGLEDR